MCVNETEVGVTVKLQGAIMYNLETVALAKKKLEGELYIHSI